MASVTLRGKPPALLTGSLMKVPSRSSFIACCSCWRVFMTIGPYHATGSSSGAPETSRKRIPWSPARTTTSLPRSNSTSERFFVSWSRTVAPLTISSVRTPRGSEASRNVPDPANT